MSTLLINETFLNTFLRTQKSGFALKSVFLSGFTLLRAFLSAQKSAQGPTQPLCVLWPKKGGKKGLKYQLKIPRNYYDGGIQVEYQM